MGRLQQKPAHIRSIPLAGMLRKFQKTRPLKLLSGQTPFRSLT
jgi:hypothetical protein